MSTSGPGGTIVLLGEAVGRYLAHLSVERFGSRRSVSRFGRDLKALVTFLDARGGRDCPLTAFTVATARGLLIAAAPGSPPPRPLP